MMNSKETLEKLEDNGRDYLLPVKVFKIIKQDLDKLEQLEKENQELKEKNLKLSIEKYNSKIVEEMNKTVVKNKNKQLLEATELNITYIDKIIILKKAISIIKAKLVPILLLQEVDTLEEYNEGLDDCDEYRLTQEEYELLKEVFENE